MRIAVAGSESWVDYNTLMRKLTVEIEDWVRLRPEDSTLTFIHTGKLGAENMVTEYVGKIERLVKQRGKTITDQVFYHADPKSRDLAMLKDVDRLVVFSNDFSPRLKSITKLAESLDIPVLIVR